MCGIAGVVSFGPIPELNITLGRMQSALEHRGPDGAGVWTNADGSAGFAHRRLAIIDTSAAGQQPMSTRDGRLTVVFNGEIYNYRQLRDELISSGAQFTSQSDTEVLLQLYRRDGPSCVTRLRGMFAFALWDAQERCCVLARDPMGIKQLYVSRKTFANGSKGLAFASELRALLRANVVPFRVDRCALADYIQFGSVAEPQTIIEDVVCLSAGSVMIWQGDKTSSFSYNLESAGSSEPDGGHEEQAATLRAALLDSVRAHFVSDVPVGIFLSGGVDSTAILALARAVGKSDLRTFSITFAEGAYAEGSTARRSAEAFRTDHSEWLLSSTEAQDLLADFWTAIDQPTVDGFNTWCVSRFASRKEMKVVLSGVGGDEMFGGYPSFRRAPMLARLGGIPRYLRYSPGWAMEHFSPNPRARRVGEFLQGTGSAESAWECTKSLFTGREAVRIADWLLGRDSSEGRGPTGRLRTPPDAEFRSQAECISDLETGRYMRNQLLRDADVMSMAWGLELRTPLVDAALANTVSRLDSHWRFREGKKALLDAVPEVPEWVRGQPKRGFEFPFQAWITDEWKETIDRHARGCPVPLSTWYQRWVIMAFREWEERAQVIR